VGAPTSTCIAYKPNNKSWGWGEVVGKCTPIATGELVQLPAWWCDTMLQDCY
jgi:hypothetical protein